MHSEEDLKTNRKRKKQTKKQNLPTPRCKKSGSHDQVQQLAPHVVGASILNFDQRDIVKTRRNCFFPLTFPLLLCDNSSTLISVVPLRLLPCALHLHPSHARSSLTRVWQQFLRTVLYWSEVDRHVLCTKLFPLSLVVLLYPFLADQYTTLH